MHPTDPTDLGPAMTVRLAYGIVVTAPVLVWMDQARTLAMIERIFGNCPTPIPDAEWRQTILHLFDMSEARRRRDPEVDELEHRLLIQQDLADRWEAS